MSLYPNILPLPLHLLLPLLQLLFSILQRRLLPLLFFTQLLQFVVAGNFVGLLNEVRLLPYQ